MKQLKLFSNVLFALGFLYPLFILMYENLTTTKIATYSGTTGGVGQLVTLMTISLIFFLVSSCLKIFYVIKSTEFRNITEFVLILIMVLPVIFIINIIYF